MVELLKGGTNWDILSSELSPGNPCSLARKWKCIIEQNLDKYAANVQWIFYSSCERWYHQISPRCASTTVVSTVAGLTTGKLGGCTGSQVGMGHLSPRR